MSRIDNMMVAISEAESSEEFLSALESHLSEERGFKVLVCDGARFGQEEQGIAAIDLDALEREEIDAIVIFGNRYRRFRSLAEMEEAIREARRNG